ncbi:hypothetical protein D3H35_01020 [Cohnella faecalis]|uniref:AraC-type arabinose-binding/dimerisation domain-containing protein n=1 Tax=Cohnella faecalis TaxID=2315694 RepID=A0A398CVJ1_9BACL|nr:hypothetical protein D3H35_01020 [Cohnella faecalis]
MPGSVRVSNGPLGQKTLHAHEGFELYLCVSGSGFYMVGDRLFPLHAGTLTVIPRTPFTALIPLSIIVPSVCAFRRHFVPKAAERRLPDDRTRSSPIAGGRKKHRRKPLFSPHAAIRPCPIFA